MFGSTRDHRTFCLSLRDLLDNRKQKIWRTIRNSEELQENTIEQLEKS